MKQVVIVDLKSEGNSFGDRTYTVTVEYRENGKALERKVFEETAHEGEHGYTRALITDQIKAWAINEKDTKFTGWV